MPNVGRNGLLAALFGVAMAITLTKFGNPIIFKALESPPTNFWEYVFATWPATWAFRLGGGLCIGVIATNYKRFRAIPLTTLFLLIAWITWVGMSLPRSVARDLSDLTAVHLTFTMAIFFLATSYLPTLGDGKTFFRFMVVGLAFTLWQGLDQHYGGLEATRKSFYELPNWEQFSPEYKLKIASNRIFGPFVYPNTFAGAILIWAPVLTLALWDWTIRLPSIAQKVLVGLFVYALAACFFWTGSKAGWLIAIVVFAAGFLHLKNIKTNVKVAVIAAVIVIGLAGFAFKYRSYFEKGATSANARLIYWKAAIQIANEHPIFGAGPGTFAKTFAPIKPEGAEMARLVHNDYLEQACDSGWPAFVLFAGFVGSAMFFSHKMVSKSPYHLAAWLGLVGWSLQSFVEFGLYIPAISWSAFGLLGWMLGSRNEIDTPKPAR